MTTESMGLRFYLIRLRKTIKNLKRGVFLNTKTREGIPIGLKDTRVYGEKSLFCLCSPSDGIVVSGMIK